MCVYLYISLSLFISLSLSLSIYTYMYIHFSVSDLMLSGQSSFEEGKKDVKTRNRKDKEDATGTINKQERRPQAAIDKAKQSKHY